MKYLAFFALCALVQVVPAFGQKFKPQDKRIYESICHAIDNKVYYLNRDLSVARQGMRQKGKIDLSTGRRITNVERSEEAFEQAAQQFKKFALTDTRDIKPVLKQFTGGRVGSYGSSKDISLEEEGFVEVSKSTDKTGLFIGLTWTVFLRNPEGVELTDGQQIGLEIVDRKKMQIPGKNYKQFVDVVEPFVFETKPIEPEKVEKAVNRYFKKQVKMISKEYRIKIPRKKKKKK